MSSEVSGSRSGCLVMLSLAEEKNERANNRTRGGEVAGEA